MLATLGWYNRETELQMISGTGIFYGVLRLSQENDSYVIEQFAEYETKGLLGNEIFPAELFEYAEANLDKYFSVLKEEKQRKVFEYFGLDATMVGKSFQSGTARELT